MDNHKKHGQPKRVDFWKEEISKKTTTEIAELLANLEIRVTIDRLTGLVNEEEFIRQFIIFSEGAFRRGARIYVLFFDFDNLKKVNDTDGHSAGDSLLKRGVALLKSVLRGSDLLGRLHGDEFIAALELENTKKGNKTIEYVVQRLTSSLERNSLSISMGLSEYKKGEYLDDVIKRADSKMMIDKTIRKAGRDY